MDLVGQVAEVSCKQELVLRLTGGTGRDAEESGEVPRSLLRPQPSAMLEGIETAALRSWAVSPNRSSVGNP